MSSDSPRRKRSARFTEIAVEAGVSVSTVDRVLNERGSVSSAKRDSVISAARKLAVPRILPDPRHGVLHFDVLMSTHKTPFLYRLGQAIDRAVQTLDRRIQVHKILLPTRDARAFEQAILHPPYRRAGLTLVSGETARVREALRQVIGSGQAVATMMSSHAGLPLHHYAGIDNYAAGRTAGYWIGRLARRKGPVLILPGMDGMAAHDERVRGCTEALHEYFPTLEVRVSDETRDDGDLAYRFVLKAMKREPLAGIYDTGHGSAGIHAALHKSAAQGATVWIGHEMLDEHRAYLQDRTMDLVIDQNPDGQVLSALQHMFGAAGLVDATPGNGPVAFSLISLPNLRGGAYMD